MDVFFDINIFSDESDSDSDLEDFENILNRRPRTVHARPNHLNFWDDEDFRKRFRLNKNTVQHLLNGIENLLRRPTERNSALSPLQQLLVCLRFYACGSFQTCIGDFGGFHQSTISIVVKSVTAAICSIKQNHIYLPQGDEATEVQQGFFNIARFPRVLLVVDGTHVKIQSPGGDQAEWYRNRKGFFSINTMIACDHKLRIRSIVARWPGSSHDMTVFRNSVLKARFDNGEMGNCIIIGDSGYEVYNYFLTPLEYPANPDQITYQESLIRTRNSIERCIGIWKRRFPCTSLGLRTKLTTTQDIIVATAILHNITINEGDVEPPEINQDIEELVVNEVPHIVANQENDHYRRELINNYFARL